jgi:CBS domain-containing protein
MLVAEVMTTELVTVGPEATVKDAAHLMLESGVSGLPVVSEGKLVGIITEADFVEREASRDQAGRGRLLDILFSRASGSVGTAKVVSEVMTTELVTADPAMRVARAARLMVDTGVKRLPVVADGRLVGIVSRHDVMRVFARRDEEIIADFDALLDQHLLPVVPGTVAVEVVSGIVTLRGNVETRADAQLLAAVVAGFDGVLRVDNELTWEVDERVPEQRFPGYPQEGSGN